MKPEDLVFQLDQLLSDIAAKQDSIVRDTLFTSWVERYDEIVAVFNAQFERGIPRYVSPDNRLTLTFQCIRISDEAINGLIRTINLLKRTIESLSEQDNDLSNQFHCFKIGHQCPHEIDPQRFLFFVGMPFSDQYVDSYQSGIKAMLEQHGIDTSNRVFKADEQPSTIDILCKICKGIQESQYIIINISGRNPNVMFELGLAYGLNKTVFLIKDENSAEISDLKGLEYTQYSNAADLANKLQNRFRDLGII